MIPTAAILAGGMATRMYPETKKIPKSLIEIGGQPFIFHQLALLRREQITHVVMCVGYLGGQIQEAVGDGSEFDMNVEFSFDGNTLLGTGRSTKSASITR
ncbi:NTP transferase domain-containing protein [candidate division KSB1 bacterium]|nr:NTP transferase domain-containing protein [candidate division KSB1 bacterium]